MIKTLRPLIVFLLVFVAITASRAQCAVTSTDGYTVHISVTPVAIIPSTMSCSGGYNYDVRYTYTVSFTGTNIPSSLWNFHVFFTCAGQSFGDWNLPLTGGTRTTGSNQWRPYADCNTVTPSICNASRIEISGPGISNQTINCPVVPAPIKLAAFNAEETEKGIRLGWETSMEKSFSHFEIERSGADLNFVTISTVEGKGALEALTSYSFLDHDPHNGRNYYRLKCVDKDGTIEYSYVVTATWGGSKGGIAIYPNPTKGRSISLQQSQDLGFPVRLSIINVLGNIVYEQLVDKAELQILLPESVNPGMYIARVSTPLTEKRISLIVN